MSRWYDFEDDGFLPLWIATQHQNVLLEESWRSVRAPEYRESFRAPHFEWDLDEIDVEVCRRETRFRPDEIRALAPIIFRTDQPMKFNSYKASPERAMYTLCSRLAYPTRYYHHTQTIGRGISWISEVFNGSVERIYRDWKDLIHWRPQLNDYEELRRYARHLGDAGWGDNRVWGAIDSTFFGFCRPISSHHQLQTCSGYYKGNGLKYQSITTPDGLVSHVSEPFLAPSNDWDIYSKSGVADKLRTIFANRESLFVFGDNAYRESYGCIPPWSDQRGFRWLPYEQLRSNHQLSGARIMVETSFGKIENYPTYNHFEQSLHSASQPVAAYFPVSVFLHNILTCLRGQADIIASRFDCQPPSVEAYLGWNWA